MCLGFPLIAIISYNRKVQPKARNVLIKLHVLIEASQRKEKEPG